MIVELRQYVMKPGGRETLIEMFDRIFLDAQEACGMEVIGVFRDLDDENRFVWFRRFEDMEARRRALECFYGGPADGDVGVPLEVTIFERRAAIEDAMFETEHSANTFPRLPIRENEDVLVTVTRGQQVAENLLPFVKQRLRLEATSRSKMR